MIFSSLEERQEVFDKISKKEQFEDLNDSQMNTIQGMYYAIEALENQRAEYDEDDEEYEEEALAIETIDESIERIEAEIADMVVAFRDDNYEYDDEE